MAITTEPRRPHNYVSSAERASRACAAERLADGLIARRAAGWHPLRGEVLAGFKLAALYHRCGIDGSWLGQAVVNRPKETERIAGWRVFEREGWREAATPPAKVKHRTHRQITQGAAEKRRRAARRAA